MKSRILVVAALMLPSAKADSGSNLVLTYVVNRHGTRNLLPKLTSALKDAPTSQQSIFVQPFGGDVFIFVRFDACIYNLLTDSEVTLLPQGQRECYNAGVSFFNRYLNSAKCSSLGTSAGEPSNTCLSPVGSPGYFSADGAMYGVINKPNVTWNNFNVLATSSALDRTLLSLRSFMAVSRSIH